MVVNLCPRQVIDFPLISIGNDGVHNSCFSEIQQSRLAGLADGVKKVDLSIALRIDWRHSCPWLTALWRLIIFDSRIPLFDPPGVKNDGFGQLSAFGDLVCEPAPGISN